MARSIEVPEDTLRTLLEMADLFMQTTCDRHFYTDPKYREALDAAETLVGSEE